MSERLDVVLLKIAAALDLLLAERDRFWCQWCGMWRAGVEEQSAHFATHDRRRHEGA